MPIVPAKLKKNIETAVLSALNSEFAEEVAANDKAVENHKKMAKAVSEVGTVVAQMLLNEVQVAAGIPVQTAGSPTNQAGATVAPGKLV